MTGFSAADQPIKSTTITNNETRQRFFNNPGDELTTSAISSTDSATGWTGNSFWSDHQGNPLYAGVDGSSASQNSSDDTPTIPIIGDVMNTLLDIVDFAFSAMGTLMGFIGSSVGFTAINTDGYSHSTVSMEVAVNIKANMVNVIYASAMENSILIKIRKNDTFPLMNKLNINITF